MAIALTKALPENTNNRHLFDAAYVAHAEGFLLAPEDITYRQLSLELFDVPGTWMLPILMTLKREGLLGFKKYGEALVGLAPAKHTFFLSVDRDALLDVAKTDTSDDMDGFLALTMSLGSEHPDLHSSYEVAWEFIKAIWGKPPLLLRNDNLADVAQNDVRASGAGDRHCSWKIGSAFFTVDRSASGLR
jgi:hypothetical protein